MCPEAAAHRQTVALRLARAHIVIESKPFESGALLIRRRGQVGYRAARSLVVASVLLGQEPDPHAFFSPSCSKPSGCPQQEQEVGDREEPVECVCLINHCGTSPRSVAHPSIPTPPQQRSTLEPGAGSLLCGPPAVTFTPRRGLSHCQGTGVALWELALRRKGAWPCSSHRGGHAGIAVSSVR